MYQPRGEFVQLIPDCHQLYLKYDYRGVEVLFFKDVEVYGFATKSRQRGVFCAKTLAEIAQAIDTSLDGE